ncbi:unnamed protein product [Hymenolepis diminuta]|uniref:Phosphoserine phosphatase n=1 Tax=Hymenolepis diminuta TaxID=6216 RepID=A0A564YPR9_HYMDI|nr:unnamed protein product [Hymenolepis diminuta]
MCRKMPDFSHIKVVCLDVDGTVCPEEGIDEVGEYCRKGDIVREITINAMEGKMSFEESLERQLKEVGLTRGILKTFLDHSPVKITFGIERLIASLRANKIDIYLVSGGLFDLVIRVARQLGIPEDHVYANRLIYDANGMVIDFDRTQPVSHSMGKAEVVALLKSKLSPGDGVLIIGDGAIDAAACPPADAFIGFGGIYERQTVKSRAKYYFYSMDDIHKFLEDAGLIRSPCLNDL